MTPVTVQHEPGLWCNRDELEGKGTVYGTRKNRCVKRGRPPDEIQKKKKKLDKMRSKQREKTQHEDKTLLVLLMRGMMTMMETMMVIREEHDPPRLSREHIC